jgi:glyoxylase-like metal-dependent hydrolase (beta-lactamase superfamily II)
MKIHELKYSKPNTYLIEGDNGRILFDTGWAGTFPAFCACMGEIDIPVQGIDYILISHFHPDHMGIAQEIADTGPVIVILDVQKDFMHSSDEVFAKEGNRAFKSIVDEKVRYHTIRDSREFLREVGVEGEILHTPGHSDDSISLCLDDGTFFVGDLNPLYELELHRGTQIEESWNRLLALNPSVLYYGHAKAGHPETGNSIQGKRDDLFKLVAGIMKYIDKGISIEKIQKKTRADITFIEDVTRMYTTHQNVGVQGILDRIEIKGR